MLSCHAIYYDGRNGKEEGGMSMLTTVVFTRGSHWAVVQTAYQSQPIEKIQCENREMAEDLAQGLALQKEATYLPAKKRFVSVQRGESAFGPIFAAIVANREGKSKFVSEITRDYNSAETVAVKYAHVNKLTYIPKFFFKKLCHQ